VPDFGDDMKVNVGSKWRGSDYSEFVVEAVENLGDEVWIHYARSDKFGSAGEEKFSCLAGAFDVRFYPCVE
jgi:hypothetical protein